VFFKDYLFVLLDAVTGEIRSTRWNKGATVQEEGAKFRKA
jgi:hypothetical protein